MTASNGSLRAFLALAKSTLRTAIAQKQRVNLVIGNESADLDSITSALLYAYLSSHPAPSSSPTATTTPDWPTLHIPILNIPSADLSIRPELLHLLPTASLEPSHLLTLDDLDPAPIPCNTRWTLVDHNALTGSLAAPYAPRVVACVDHHADEGVVSKGAAPRVVEPAGSCTSLVLRECRGAWDALAAGEGAGVGELARLALASVLVDTEGLRDEGKTREVDREAVRVFEDVVRRGDGAGRWDREGFLAEVKAAKGDLHGLGVRDVLRKDFKAWEVGGGRWVGVCSVVRSVGWLVGRVEEEGRGGMGDVLAAFGRARGCGVVVVMTAFTGEESGFERELVVKVVDGEMRGLLDLLEGRGVEELGLSEDKGTVGVAEDGMMKVWRQARVDKSRKQVAPLLREMMASL